MPLREICFNAGLLSFVPPGQGLSGFCHLRHSEPAQALDFIPAVQAAAQETEHPQVTSATELPNPPALGQDVAAEPPAVRYSAPVSALLKAPPPDHYQAGERFENEQPHLQRDQQQEEVMCVLEQYQQAVAVSVETLGVTRAEFHGRAATRGIDLRCAAMVQLRRRHRYGLLTGNPHAPRQVELIREHKEHRVEPAQCPE